MWIVQAVKDPVSLSLRVVDTRAASMATGRCDSQFPWSWNVDQNSRQRLGFGGRPHPSLRRSFHAGLGEVMSKPCWSSRWSLHVHAGDRRTAESKLMSDMRRRRRTDQLGHTSAWMRGGRRAAQPRPWAARVGFRRRVSLSRLTGDERRSWVLHRRLWRTHIVASPGEKTEHSGNTGGISYSDVISHKTFSPGQMRWGG